MSSRAASRSPGRAVAAKAAVLSTPPRSVGKAAAPSAAGVSTSSLPVQEHLHEVVHYTTAGKTSLTAAEAKLVAFIQATYLIDAKAFDLDKTTFGPLSGMSHEERLMSAHARGLLEPHRKTAGGKDSTSAASAASSSSSAVAVSPSSVHITPARPKKTPLAGGGSGGGEEEEEAAGGATSAAADLSGPTRMCRVCAQTGHWGWDCPTLCE